MSHNSPMVSVIIPCYNAEAYLAECISSVLFQTHANTEVICIDDGSRDGTLKLLRRLQEESPAKIRVLTGPNRGAPAARNRGLSEANGEYIQFMDADDLLRPTKITHQVSILEKEQNPPDLVAGSWELRAMDGSIRIVEVRRTDPWVGLIKSRLGNTVSNLWKRSFLVGLGGFSESLKSSQEADLMFRMLQNGAQVCFDRANLTIVRKTPGSITDSAGETKLLRRVELRQQMFAYLASRDMLTAERKTAVYDDHFNTVLSLYASNREAGLRLHDDIVPKGFRPRIGRGVYPIAYQLLGLDAAQRLRRVWGLTRRGVGLR